MATQGHKPFPNREDSIKQIKNSNAFLKWDEPQILFLLSRGIDKKYIYFISLDFASFVFKNF